MCIVFDKPIGYLSAATIRSGLRHCSISRGIWSWCNEVVINDLCPCGNGELWMLANVRRWALFLFSFDGRVGRRKYWTHFFLPFLFLHMVVVIILPPDPWLFGGVMIPLILVSTWALLAVGTKRCRDINRSPWFLLILFVPFGWLWLLLDLGLRRGTNGPDRFGSPV